MNQLPASKPRYFVVAVELQMKRRKFNTRKHLILIRGKVRKLQLETFEQFECYAAR